MKKYVLDTNVYIAADRDLAVAEALHDFSINMLPRLYLHSVVVQEILAGAIDPRRERLAKSTLVTPYEKRGRIVTPSHSAWRRAGEAMAALVSRRLMSPGGFGRSFPNDCLLACSCAAEGMTIVTRNVRDFELLAHMVDVKLESFPPA